MPSGFLKKIFPFLGLRCREIQIFIIQLTHFLMLDYWYNYLYSSPNWFLISHLDLNKCILTL